MKMKVKDSQERDEAGGWWLLQGDESHFVPELALLLGGETQFVDDLYCHIPACLPVLPWGKGRGGGG